jgi:hypothetical protein
MLVGAVGLAAEFAVNPKFALPAAGRVRFQSVDFTVASDPACDRVPFQTLLMVSPLASTQLTVQPNIVDVVGFATVTWAW